MLSFCCLRWFSNQHIGAYHWASCCRISFAWLGVFGSHVENYVVHTKPMKQHPLMDTRFNLWPRGRRTFVSQTNLDNNSKVSAVIIFKLSVSMQKCGIFKLHEYVDVVVVVVVVFLSPERLCSSWGCISWFRGPNCRQRTRIEGLPLRSKWRNIKKCHLFVAWQMLYKVHKLLCWCISCGCFCILYSWLSVVVCCCHVCLGQVSMLRRAFQATENLGSLTVVLVARPVAIGFIAQRWFMWAVQMCSFWCISILELAASFWCWSSWKKSHRCCSSWIFLNDIYPMWCHMCANFFWTYSGRPQRNSSRHMRLLTWRGSGRGLSWTNHQDPASHSTKRMRSKHDEHLHAFYEIL